MNREERPLPTMVFDVWSASDPPPGFAERVLSQLAPQPPPLRSRWRTAAMVLVGAAVALALVVLAHPLLPASGEHRASARQTVLLATRGLAVLEPDAEIVWEKRLRSVHVRQTYGAVFYRVERGGPFVVETPAGRIAVTGTCFRVEVETMHERTRTIVGTAVGAALGALITVTVYEGQVALAHRHNVLSLSAGEVGQAASYGVPRRVDSPLPSSASTVESPFQGARLPEATAARAVAPRTAALEAELETLRRSMAEDEERRRAADKWPARSKEDLLAMAKRCEVRYDMPPSAWNLGHTVDERRAAELGFSDDERRAVNQALHEEGIRLVEPLRALYIETTGNADAAAALEPFTLQQEIMAKASPETLALARQRISHERAGLVTPGDPSQGTPVERALRLLSTAGDEWERRLAVIVGVERAAKLRTPNRLFGRWRIEGCPGQGGRQGGD